MPTSRRSRKETIEPRAVRLTGFCRQCWKRFSLEIDRSEPMVYKEVVRERLECCRKPDPVVCDSFLILNC